MTEVLCTHVCVALLSDRYCSKREFTCQTLRKWQNKLGLVYFLELFSHGLVSKIVNTIISHLQEIPMSFFFKTTN